MNNRDPYAELMVALKGEEQYKKEMQEQIEEAEKEYEKLMSEIKDIPIPPMPEPSEYFSCSMYPECFSKMKVQTMDGYSKIEKELNLKNLKYTEDIFVTIKCGDGNLNAILQPNENYDGYIWDWDWWEGEENVELVGAIALSDIRIYGNKLEYKDENKEV